MGYGMLKSNIYCYLVEMLTGVSYRGLFLRYLCIIGNFILKNACFSTEA